MGILSRISDWYRSRRPTSITDKAPQQATAVVSLLSREKEGERGLVKPTLTEWFFQAPRGQPRRVNISELKALAQSPWVRTCITTLIMEIIGLEWRIVAKDEEDESPTTQQFINETEEFFDLPNDNRESFNFLLMQILRDVFEIDAGVWILCYEEADLEEIEKTIATRYKDPLDDDWKIAWEKMPFKVPKKGARCTQMYCRDGGTFMIDVDHHGIVQGYWQYSYANPGAMPQYFSKDEIIYIMQNPRAGWVYGWAGTQTLKDVLQTLQATVEWNEEFFDNFSVPAGIITPKVEMNAAEAKRFATEMQTRAKNERHKFMFVDKEVEFLRLSLTNQEMDFKELQASYKKVVQEVYHITPNEMGAEKINRSTAEEQSEVFRRKAIKPITTIIEFHINNTLIPRILGIENPKDCPVKFTFGKAMDRFEEERQTKRAIDLKNAHLISINEGRGYIGEDPVDDLKADQVVPEPQPMFQFGQQREETEERRGESRPEQQLESPKPLGQRGTQEVPKKPKKYLGTSSIEAPEPLSEIELPYYGDDVFYGLPNPSTQKDDPRAPNVERLEDMFLISLSRLFAKQEIELLEQAFAKADTAEQPPPDPEIKERLDEVQEAVEKIKEKIDKLLGTEHKEEFEKIIKEYAEEAVKKGGFKAFHELKVKISFDMTDPLALEYLQNQLEFLANNKYDTVRERLKAQIDEGIRKGEGTDAIAERIRKEYSSLQTFEAENIARTETLRAFNYGREAGYVQSKVVKGKQWIVTWDSRLCEACLQMAINGGQIALLGQPFMHPERGPIRNPQDIHPQCRCTFVPVLFSNVELIAGAYIRKTNKMKEAEENGNGDMKKALKRLYLHEGKSCREIAEELKVCKKTVANWLKKFNIPTRPSGFSEGEKE